MPSMRVICARLWNVNGRNLRVLALIIGVQVLVLLSFYPSILAKWKGKYKLRFSPLFYREEKSSSHDKPWTIKETLDNRHQFAKANDIINLLPIDSFRSSCSQLNFAFASPILEPYYSEKEKDLFLLIFIMSSPGGTVSRERRNVLRSTWVLDRGIINSKRWKHVFLLGKSNRSEINSDIKSEARLFNDIMLLNFTDSYDNLVIKVLSGLRWAFMNGNARFILKADDDVYVRVPRLISWLNEFGSNKFYGGYIHKPGAHVNRFNTSDTMNLIAEDCYPKERYPSYASGPVYVLSSDAIPFLFHNMHRWKVFPVEDAYLGLLAETSGIKPVIIPGIQIYSSRTYPGVCQWASLIAVGHYFDSTDIWLLHRRAQAVEELRPFRMYALCIFNNVGLILLCLTIISVVVVVKLKRRFTRGSKTHHACQGRKIVSYFLRSSHSAAM